MARPRERTYRGQAIGAEIVHAPNPAKTLATMKPWEVRYIDALPTETGLYFGNHLTMRLTELEAVNQEIELVEGCDGDIIEEDPKTASTAGAAEPAGGHAKPIDAAGH